MGDTANLDRSGQSGSDPLPMPRPDFQQTDSGTRTPPSWESSPWMPEDRVVEEPRRPREEPLRLSSEHLLESTLESESIRRAR